MSDSKNFWAPEQTPFGRMSKPISEFMHVQSSSGIVLALCTLIAIVLANSSLAESYAYFWKTHIAIGIGDFVLDYPLYYWINDGLMAIFFFVVGLEIKREIVLGELSEPRKVVLPVVAAIGGAALPAGIYMYFQAGQAGEAGWAIPMATDIAFVVGLLALLGPRVPHGLKIMLLSLAIVDDLMAVIVIAIFYTEQVHLMALLGAGVGIVFVAIMRFLGIREIGPYWVVGSVVWVFALKSGVHPTIAGVILGLMTPTKASVNEREFSEVVENVFAFLRSSKSQADATSFAEEEPLNIDDAAKQMAHMSKESISPLERLEHDLHPWVSFAIMPIFALANAGVPIDMESLKSPVAIAVAVGLILGKPLGIFASSFVAVKLGAAQLPSGVNWKVLLGAGALSGIGFTMSLFIAGLSFSGGLLLSAKAGILTGSILSAVLGAGILLAFMPKTTNQ